MIRRPPIPPLFPSTPFFDFCTACKWEVCNAVAQVRRASAATPRRIIRFARSRKAVLTRPEKPKACKVSSLVKSYLRSEEHTSELQSQSNLVCRLLLEKKKNE